jgi:hypothetical protein
MRVLLQPRWLALHAATIVLVVAFAGLAWWQFGRAFAGNTLSYAYAVEWPVFAGFVIFVWSKEVRRALAVTKQGSGPRDTTDTATPERATAGPATASIGAAAGTAAGADTLDTVEPVKPFVRTARPASRGARPATRSGPAYDDADDPDLAAYNRYLGWLNANPGKTPADYPG